MIEGIGLHRQDPADRRVGDGIEAQGLLSIDLDDLRRIGLRPTFELPLEFLEAFLDEHVQLGILERAEVRGRLQAKKGTLDARGIESSEGVV